MPLTAANSMPIQTGQVQGAPRPTAAMLTRKKKKKPETKDFRGANGVQPDGSVSPAATTAAILSRRKK